MIECCDEVDDHNCDRYMHACSTYDMTHKAPPQSCGGSTLVYIYIYIYLILNFLSGFGIPAASGDIRRAFASFRDISPSFRRHFKPILAARPHNCSQRPQDCSPRPQNCFQGHTTASQGHTIALQGHIIAPQGHTTAPLPHNCSSRTWIFEQQSIYNRCFRKISLPTHASILHRFSGPLGSACTPFGSAGAPFGSTGAPFGFAGAPFGSTGAPPVLHLVLPALHLAPPALHLDPPVLQ
jgi:hypothetical protein